MDRKKDIGKVFQDRLGDLKESPRENLWDAIASDMDQSTKRRILPFWYYIGGALLGALALTLIVWQPGVKSSSTSDALIIKPEKSVEYTPNTTQESKYQTTLTYGQDSIQNTRQKLTIANKKISKNTNSIQSIVKTNTIASPSPVAVNTVALGKKAYARNNTALHPNSIENSSPDRTNVTLDDVKKALQNRTVKVSPEELKARALYQAKITKELQDAIQQQHALNEKNYKEQLTKEQLEKEALAAAILQKEEQKSKAIAHLIKTESAPKTDQERSLDRKAAKEYKIAFSPYTSLLSYGSLVRGSSIDDRLVNNPRETITTVGYGIRVDYPLSPKASLRLGVGVAPLSYRTENFQVSSVNGNINIFQLTSINAASINQPGIETSIEAQDFFAQNNVVSIEQDIAYIEVPVDYQYRLINKRVGLSINTGLSLFVLTENSVFASADNGESILIGRASDLNDLSLALNLGLSTHYNFSKSWRFNAEPAFKYQLNPYSEAITNFRPYYFGLQFGLSYKF